MKPEYNEEIFEIQGSDGQLIHCVYNYIDGDDNAPLIVAAPQFEGTVRHNLLPMLFLVSNGFRVLRFDFTDHRGNSDGARAEFTLTSGLADLADVLSGIGTSLPDDRSRLSLFAGSLSSRLAVRYLASNHDRIDSFLSLVGVVNSAATTLAASGMDYENLMRDSSYVYGYQKAVNYELNFDRWMRDFAEEDWARPDRTRDEITQMVTPTYLIVAAADDWVNIDEYPYVYEQNKEILRATHQIPGAAHELYKDPETLKEAMRTATRCFRRHYSMDENIELVEPTVAELISLNGKERERELVYKKPQPQNR